MRAAFVRGLITAAEKNPKIMLITGDLGYRFLEPFAKRFPDRFLNIGVSEANMVTVASGLSTTGFVPFIYSIATFASMRAFEQIRTDISLQNLNVKIVGIGAGLAYTKAGPTHHSMEDIALMRLLPNMKIVVPIDPPEAESATAIIASDTGPCYFRLERNPPDPYNQAMPDFRIGKSYRIAGTRSDAKTRASVALLFTGTKLGLVKDTAKMLEKRDISVSLYAFPTIHPLDSAALKIIAKKHTVIVTLEEHRVSGGFGTAVGECLIQMNLPVVLVKIGLRDGYSTLSSDYDRLLEHHGMVPKLMAAKILGRLRPNLL
jgi:transketolase